MADARAIVRLGGHEFRCRVAATPREHATGLQDTPWLGPDEGMLFVFDPPRATSFHMGEVAYPIDLVFVAPGGRVAKVVHHAQPGTRERWSHHKVEAVLEVRGGSAAPALAATHRLATTRADYVIRTAQADDDMTEYQRLSAALAEVGVPDIFAADLKSFTPKHFEEVSVWVDHMLDKADASTMPMPDVLVKPQVGEVYVVRYGFEAWNIEEEQPTWVDRGEITVEQFSHSWVEFSDEDALRQFVMPFSVSASHLTWIEMRGTDNIVRASGGKRGQAELHPELVHQYDYEWRSGRPPEAELEETLRLIEQYGPLPELLQLEDALRTKIRKKKPTVRVPFDTNTRAGQVDPTKQHVADPADYIVGLIEAMAREPDQRPLDWHRDALNGEMAYAVITQEDIVDWVENFGMGDAATAKYMGDVATSREGMQVLGDGIVLAGLAQAATVVVDENDLTDKLVLWRQHKDFGHAEPEHKLPH